MGRGVAVGGMGVGGRSVGTNRVEVGLGVVVAGEKRVPAGVGTAVGVGVCDVAAAVGLETVGTAVGAFCPPNSEQAAKNTRRAADKNDAAVSFNVRRLCLSGYR